MADSPTITLDMSELRAVAAFAVTCARTALKIFEQDRPGDPRSRDAIDAAQTFVDGAKRAKLQRDGAWAALRAAQEARAAGQPAASEAARAAAASCSAAYLHPLAKATQVKHILGSAGYAAHALEIAAGDLPAVGEEHIARFAALATPAVLEVLDRYPAAPPGGARAGALIRLLDTSLR
ncbi:putative immunity protein [Catenuloplanes japonicus]|uniref:putative immunity protein n=1 Tax=Catenuloplanes japonicus TaxID=33876 RepID=UPI0018DB8FEB|nr:exonuclease SbcC [Catenuloplanes japonicus]